MKNRINLFLLVMLLLFSLDSQAQQAKIFNHNPAAHWQTESSARTSADESFELNITERRITRSNYSASTAVEIGDQSSRGLSLRVGVGVSAGTIDVLLRDVAGLVRFKATLEPVLARIRSHRALSAPR